MLDQSVNASFARPESSHAQICYGGLQSAKPKDPALAEYKRRRKGETRRSVYIVHVRTLELHSFWNTNLGLFGLQVIPTAVKLESLHNESWGPWMRFSSPRSRQKHRLDGINQWNGSLYALTVRGRIRPSERWVERRGFARGENSYVTTT